MSPSAQLIESMAEALHLREWRLKHVGIPPHWGSLPYEHKRRHRDQARRDYDLARGHNGGAAR